MFEEQKSFDPIPFPERVRHIFVRSNAWEEADEWHAFTDRIVGEKSGFKIPFL